MKKILVTGASGFIGSAIAENLSSKFIVKGLYYNNKPPEHDKITFQQCDLCNFESVADICDSYKPDVVIHSAAIAHQRLGAVDQSIYMRVNCDAALNIAKRSLKANPAVQFVFLSSVSVYGENNLSIPVSEKHICKPTGDYGLSKLNAEKHLTALALKNELVSPVILRLAPVYDKEWSFNLDRRVLAPSNLCYLRFGSGLQKMSALARPNLVDFIRFIISDSEDKKNKVDIVNVTDAEPYEFNRIIRIFLKSLSHPVRPVVRIPTSAIFLLTRIAGLFLPGKREWIHASYEKLASSLIFDNTKMVKTGFKPKHNLETVYLD